jgi:tryptophanyl-tRNA synthetase
VLLQSRGFESPKDAGRLSAALVEAGDDAAAVAALLLDCAPADELALPREPIVAALAALKADKLARDRAKPA